MITNVNHSILGTGWDSSKQCDICGKEGAYHRWCVNDDSQEEQFVSVDFKTGKSEPFKLDSPCSFGSGYFCAKCSLKGCPKCGSRLIDIYDRNPGLVF